MSIMRFYLITFLVLGPPCNAASANNANPVVEENSCDAFDRQAVNVDARHAMEKTNVALLQRLGGRQVSETTFRYTADPPLDSKELESQYIPGVDGTYAQNYQDVWLMSLAKLNGWDTAQGFFLDLGAFKGFECSNSALVEKQLGWKGICVEPRPVEKAFDGRGCVLARRALSGSTGKSIRFSGEPGSQLQHMGEHHGDSHSDVIKTLSVSDLLRCVDAKGHFGKVAEPGTKGDGTALCDRVPIGRLEIPSFINFVSLDIEGQERDVLRTFPFDDVRVGAWVIEEKRSGRGRDSLIDALLKEKGYQRVPVANSGVDAYYVHNSTKYSDDLNEKKKRMHPAGSHGC